MTSGLVRWKYVYMISASLWCYVSLRDVRPELENYLPDYSLYHNLTAIDSRLSTQLNNHPRYLRLIPSFTSRDNHSQFVIHMTDHAKHLREDNQLKIPILLSFGEHAREFLPVESLLDFLHNVTSGIMSSERSSAFQYSLNVLRNFDVYIISLANPDGRAYIEKKNNYCWRGNGRGVDLNRNFLWQFGQEGSSTDHDDEEYRGASALSERETAAFTNLTAHVAFTAFISFHSGIQHIYLPFCAYRCTYRCTYTSDSESHRIGRRPDNYDDMLRLAESISASTNDRYSYGTAFELIHYTAAGTVIDYMAGVKKIPFSLVIELWGNSQKHDKCFDMFNPPSHDLNRVVRSLRPIYETIFNYLLVWTDAHTVLPQGNQHNAIELHMHETPSLTFSYVLLLVVFIVVVIVAIKHQIPCKLRAPTRRIISLRALGSTFYSSPDLLKST